MLGNPKQFLDSLFDYDKENIPESVIKTIKPYIEDPKFMPAEIKKVRGTVSLSLVYPPIHARPLSRPCI